jgi:hypothetical protein
MRDNCNGHHEPLVASLKQVGPTEVGIEFQQPAPDFWRVAFPPPDWFGNL